MILGIKQIIKMNPRIEKNKIIDFIFSSSWFIKLLCKKILTTQLINISNIIKQMEIIRTLYPLSL